MKKLIICASLVLAFSSILRAAENGRDYVIGEYEVDLDQPKQDAIQKCKRISEKYTTVSHQSSDWKIETIEDCSGHHFGPEPVCRNRSYVSAEFACY